MNTPNPPSQLGVTHWLCADGRIVTPPEMTHPHKLNAIRMIAHSKRISRAFMAEAMLAFAYAAGGRGEMAADAAREAGDELLSPTYRMRVDKVFAVSPVLREMGRLLTEAGISPYIDHKRVLGDEAWVQPRDTIEGVSWATVQTPGLPQLERRPPVALRVPRRRPKPQPKTACPPESSPAPRPPVRRGSTKKRQASARKRK